jgi:hypothetical protein
MNYRKNDTDKHNFKDSGRPKKRISQQNRPDQTDLGWQVERRGRRTCESGEEKKAHGMHATTACWKNGPRLPHLRVYTSRNSKTAKVISHGRVKFTHFSHPEKKKIKQKALDSPHDGLFMWSTCRGSFSSVLLHTHTHTYTGRQTGPGDDGDDDDE